MIWSSRKKKEGIYSSKVNFFKFLFYLNVSIEYTFIIYILLHVKKSLLHALSFLVLKIVESLQCILKSVVKHMEHPNILKIGEVLQGATEISFFIFTSRQGTNVKRNFKPEFSKVKIQTFSDFLLAGLNHSRKTCIFPLRLKQVNIPPIFKQTKILKEIIGQLAYYQISRSYSKEFLTLWNLPSRNYSVVFEKAKSQSFVHA